MNISQHNKATFEKDIATYSEGIVRFSCNFKKNTILFSFNVASKNSARGDMKEKQNILKLK